MLDNERWDDVAERVVADDFSPAHTVISLLKWRVCRKAVVYRSDYPCGIAGTPGATR